jgi:hypothetical protein
VEAQNYIGLGPRNLTIQSSNTSSHPFAEREGDYMPLYQMKEVWTPLKLMGIKLFKFPISGDYYIKVWKNPRKKIEFLTNS